MAKYEIKYLRKKRFPGKPGIAGEVTGWALYDPIRGGYYAFGHDRDPKTGILVPYIPCGGKKALQAIVDAGGFLSEEGMELVQSID